MAQEQRQWEQAEKHFLESLRIFIEYDSDNSAIVFRSLTRLWRERKETNLIEQVAAILGKTPEEIERAFQGTTEPSLDQSEGTGA